MKLYSFFNSSASFRVRIGLALKGIDYEFVGVDIRSGEQSAPNFLGTVSPSPLVPVLQDGDLKLSQSVAILDYLDQVAPSPRLIPAEPRARARELEFAHIIACDTHPLNNLRILKYLKNELTLDAAAVNAWYQKWIDHGVGAAESVLQHENKGTPFCFGEQATLADCVLVPQMANALRKGCDVSAFPVSMAIYEHALGEEAFQQALPERQPDFVSP
jgi:maleylacetoacetate isomerase